MKRWSWLLVVALVASPVFGEDKKKDDKKSSKTSGASFVCPRPPFLSISANYYNIQ